MNILFSVLDCLKILFQAFRYGIVNIPIDSSGSIAIKALGLLNPFFLLMIKKGFNKPNALIAIEPLLSMGMFTIQIGRAHV